MSRCEWGDNVLKSLSLANLGIDKEHISNNCIHSTFNTGILDSFWPIIILKLTVAVYFMTYALKSISIKNMAYLYSSWDCISHVFLCKWVKDALATTYRIENNDWIYMYLSKPYRMWFYLFFEFHCFKEYIFSRSWCW